MTASARMTSVRMVPSSLPRCGASQTVSMSSRTGIRITIRKAMISFVFSFISASGSIQFHYTGAEVTVL